MSAGDDLKRKLDQRLKGWRRLPNGDIAYLPFIGTAVFPMTDGAAFAVRFEASRFPGDRSPDNLQVKMTAQQCRETASQLIAVAEYLEKESKPPEGEKPN